MAECLCGGTEWGSPMVTRRHLIRAGTVGGAALLVPAAFVERRQAFADPVPGGTLDPNRIPKYVLPLFVLPAMPGGRPVGGTDFHEIAARQFNQRILPPGFRTTPVFGYGSVSGPATFHYPAFTIEAQVGCTTRVRWANELVTSTGRFRPHLLPVDPTLHWANPPGGTAGRDMRPEFKTMPGPYRGPVPLVTHLHGAHVFEEYDGYPEAWYLPAAGDVPKGWAKVGTFHDRFRAESVGHTGVPWPAGSAVFDYHNDQRATTLWYHDHTLGMTRTNIYAGLTGLYLLRGGSSDLPAGVLPGPAPLPGERPNKRYYDIQLTFQDRSFNADDTLFFPSTRGPFGDTPPDGPFIPTTDVSPIWNPEFFGNTMVVNGNTWPVLAVERRRYRFRLLNACNARTLFLKVATNPLAKRPAAAALPIWAIGTDGGFLPAPVALAAARLGVAERMDVIVDFSAVPAGTTLYLINEGPDEPFGGGTVGTDFDPADPGATGPLAAALDREARRRERDPPAVPQRAGFRRVPGGADRGDAGHHQRRRHAGAAAVDGGGHREPAPGRDGDLGVPQLHRGRAPDPRAPGAVRGARPAAVRRRAGAGAGWRSPAAGVVGDRPEGHGARATGRDHPDQGALRHRGAVRVALPHHRPRGQRDDAPVPSRTLRIPYRFLDIDVI